MTISEDLYVRNGGVEAGPLVEQFLPVYDVSDGVATVVEADESTVWEALVHTDLVQVGRDKPLVGMLGALRLMPEIMSDLLHGEVPPGAPERLQLRDLVATPGTHGGWVLLGEKPGQEIALGLVGKFWRPVIEYSDVPAEQFREFTVPGWAKTIYGLSVRPLDPGRTLLAGVMRTATTDEHARRWFRRYWALGVGSGAHTLLTGLLDAAGESAERASKPATT